MVYRYTLGTAPKNVLVPGDNTEVRCRFSFKNFWPAAVDIKFRNLPGSTLVENSMGVSKNSGFTPKSSIEK